MQMRAQLVKRHGAIDRSGVTYHVEVAVSEIDYPLPRFIFYVRLGYGPLGRHRPVKALGTARHLIGAQLGDVPSQDSQSLPHSRTSDAPANWEEFLSECISSRAGVGVWQCVHG